MTLDPDTVTVLDLVAAHPATQAVFRSYDAKAGACLLCQGLFDTISGLAERFGLDRNALLTDLERAIQGDTRT